MTIPLLQFKITIECFIIWVVIYLNCWAISLLLLLLLLLLLRVPGQRDAPFWSRQRYKNNGHGEWVSEWGSRVCATHKGWLYGRLSSGQAAPPKPPETGDKPPYNHAMKDLLQKHQADETKDRSTSPKSFLIYSSISINAILLSYKLGAASAPLVPLRSLSLTTHFGMQVSRSVGEGQRCELNSHCPDSLFSPVFGVLLVVPKQPWNQVILNYMTFLHLSSWVSFLYFSKVFHPRCPCAKILLKRMTIASHKVLCVTMWRDKRHCRLIMI